MIRVIQNKGFSLTFDNGLTISVQIGHGNYCTNKDNSKPHKSEQSQEITECNNAEIAIWDENDKWFSFGNDVVKGWVSVVEVGMWIDKVRRAKSIKTIKRVK